MYVRMYVRTGEVATARTQTNSWRDRSSHTPLWDFVWHPACNRLYGVSDATADESPPVSLSGLGPEGWTIENALW